MEEELLEAAFTKVSQIASTLSLPVNWPNVSFDPSGHSEYLSVVVFPTSPEGIKTTGKSKHMWLLQITYCRKEGDGALVPSSFIDTLRAELPFNTKLTGDNHTFQSTTQGEVIPALQSGDGWYKAPVQFRFITFN